jgi:Cof subfamily protein (haloacid dehalogenase superfamily)
LRFDWIMVTDVDGTLDYRCTGIGDRVISSAVEYVEAGGGLALATGRAVVSTARTAERMHVNVPSILYGGAMIYDYKSQKCVWKCVLPGEIVDIARDIAVSFPDVSVIVYTDLGISILSSNEMLWTKGVPEECDRRFVDAEICGDVLKLNLVGERDRVKSIRDKYFSGEEYNFNFSSRHFAEVVSPLAGKDKALLALSDMMEVPLERFIAMGDAQNDYEMLKLAHHAYTLENASDSIKAVADVTLPHCIDQGAAEGFRLAKELLLKSTADRV